MKLKPYFTDMIKYIRQILPDEKLQGVSIFLIALWLLIMLVIPFVENAFGEKAFVFAVALSVLFQAFVVVFLMIRATGASRTAVVAVKILILTWVIEAIGAKTGFPFGSYAYTNRLQPQLLGVPLVIPFAWLMMLPPSWVVARRITGPTFSLKFIALSALAFTAWDLFLDPQMVKWQFWRWKTPGGYFGIPSINFVGWIFSAMLITIIVRPPRLPERSLLLIYTLMWLLETLGLLKFWKLTGPALSGFAGMGIFALLAMFLGRRKKA